MSRNTMIFKAIILLITSILILNGCSISYNGDGGLLKEKVDEEIKEFLEGVNIEEIDLEIGIGEINIRYGEVDVIEVICIKAVEANTNEKAKNALEDFQVDILNENNKLSIDAYLKSDKTKEIWSNQGESLIKGITYKLNVDITIPKEDISLKSSNLKIGVGDVEVDSILGSLILKSGVGSITIKNSDIEMDIKMGVGDMGIIDTTIHGDNMIEIGTGTVKGSISNLKEANTLKVNTGVGDIDLTLPDDGDYHLVYKGFMEKSVDEIYGTGETKINLSAGVGEVNVK